MPSPAFVCGCQCQLNAEPLVNPVRDVLVYFDGAAPRGISQADYLGHFRRAFDKIESHCGMRFDIAPAAAKAHERVIGVNLDGPGGVLADQQLPYPAYTQLRMRVDFAEDWSDVVRLPLWLVVLHELGHFLGYGHETGRLALMNPVLNTGIDDFQPHEIESLRANFGPPRPRATPAPVPQPSPGPAPAPAGEPDLVLTIGDHKYRVPLVKVS